uniref:Uncharacterized protein n=2 Tax=Brassiceae TaxID=981071 RepID=R4I206_RAPSA|nr:hypothetical protein RasatMp014 [Raphanus sativus]AGC81704.1 hypothetical protein DCGMS_00440 [Raphanus sativus]AIE42548.1 hypothetical protein RadishMT_p016 [Raphanus sativus]QGW48288.1 hypothetical protein [Raphanus sativus]QGW48510.1 hypothetical protein [Raphanus sativus]
MARIRISPQMFIWPSFSFFVLSRARFKNFFLFIKSVISPLGSFSLLVWPSHCSQFGLLALPHITGGEGTPLMGGNCSPSFAWSIREPISSANSILIFLTSSYFFLDEIIPVVLGRSRRGRFEELAPLPSPPTE